MNWINEVIKLNINCEHLETIIIVLISYLVSGIFGYCFSKKIHDKAYEVILGDKNKIQEIFPDIWSSQFVGIIERVIITTAIIFHVWGAVAVWYAVKAISDFKLWNDNSDIKSNNPNGRAVFNIYLIMTGLSLLYGALGGQIYLWLSGDKIEIIYPFLATVALIVSNCLILRKLNYIKKEKVDLKKKKEDFKKFPYF